MEERDVMLPSGWLLECKVGEGGGRGGNVVWQGRGVEPVMGGRRIEMSVSVDDIGGDSVVTGRGDAWVGVCVVAGRGGDVRVGMSVGESEGGHCWEGRKEWTVSPESESFNDSDVEDIPK